MCVYIPRPCVDPLSRLRERARERAAANGTNNALAHALSPTLSRERERGRRGKLANHALARAGFPGVEYIAGDPGNIFCRHLDRMLAGQALHLGAGGLACRAAAGGTSTSTGNAVCSRARTSTSIERNARRKPVTFPRPAAQYPNSNRL